MMKARFFRGQVTIELTVALIILFTLVMGTFRFFLWVNKRMVLRQEAYDSSRIDAGSGTKEVLVDESALPELDILGDSK